ncbi:TNF-like receptor protein CrmB [Cotia virus SPAn232]|uniref:TNF-like receptor protein CrmB n=2 Tax=Cotia virus TaxID=39444 RepID=H6TAD6_9POXV|nr:TNF-like receptor protein CrmB [Cotia virus SPAn232]AFB76970.1 TNF-like receptor protein CrmB [Cotia virus SPAn232]AIT70783.1 TNF-like receptor protein CrmB [Cotia virus]
MIKIFFMFVMCQLSLIYPYEYEDKYISNTFNYISIDIEMSNVNKTSCTKEINDNGKSQIINTSELSITLNITDCDPKFTTGYYSTNNKNSMAGFFTSGDTFQDKSKKCKLSMEIKCIGKDVSYLKTDLVTTPPNPKIHSEDLIIIGSCLKNIDVYFLYLYLDDNKLEKDYTNYHIGNNINTSGILPQECNIV